VRCCSLGTLKFDIQNLARQSLLSRRQQVLIYSRTTSSGDSFVNKGLFPAPSKRTSRDHVLICRLMRDAKARRKSLKFGTVCLEAAAGTVARAAAQFALKRGASSLGLPAKRRKLDLPHALSCAATSPALGIATRCATGALDAARQRDRCRLKRQACVTDLLPSAHLRIAWPRGPQGSLAFVAGSSGLAKTTVAYVRKSAAHVFLEAQGRLVDATFDKSRTSPLCQP